MARQDPFSAQIIELVRKMPDEAILALVRNQLGAVAETTTHAPAAVAAVAAVAEAAPAPRRPSRLNKTATRARATVSRPKEAPAKAAPRVSPAKRRTSVARQEVLSSVERAVRGAKGLSASEVAQATGIGQVRVATALRELKLAGRIYQGGDRRFARYAADPRTAKAASAYARSHAGGPKAKKPARPAPRRKK